MQVTIFGTGYVGLVTGVCLADIGHNVVCVDVDHAKIDLLKNGESPIYEPGMDEMLEKNIQAKRVSFTTDAVAGIKHAEVIFIAVGTPSADDGSADLRYVNEVARTIGQHLNHECVIVNKSTVPVGTLDKVKDVIAYELKERNVNIKFSMASNPEFLKQGDALADFMHGPRTVVGSDDTHTIEQMQQLYKPLTNAGQEFISMDVTSAELTKYAANAFLAAKISFINEMSKLTAKMGADIENIRIGVGSDPRIGPAFLRAGCGYGGSCFPKDVKALLSMAHELDIDAPILAAVDHTNIEQKQILFKGLQKYFNNELKGKTIALWGLAFKPNTDDMREAPSRVLLESLWQAGATVRAYDPVAMNEAKRIYGERDDFILCDNMQDTLTKADALVIVTEWGEFSLPDLEIVKQKMHKPVIFDGRNLFEPEQMVKAGIEYYCIGRGNALAS